MFENIISYYYNYFTNDDNDKFILLKSSVCLIVCNGLYNKFIKEGIPTLESLPLDKKTEYWKYACMYQPSTQKRIEASRTLYVLHLISAE